MKIHIRLFCSAVAAMCLLLPVSSALAAVGGWSTTGSLHSYVGYMSASILPGDKVLVAGGWGLSGGDTGAEVYDATTGVFSRTGALQAGRYNNATVALSDGRVLFAGGVGSINTTLASAEIYDPASGSFATTGVMNSQRSQASGILLADGKVLIAGGRSVGSGVMASAELYDPVSGTFSATGSLITARSDASAVRLANGNVLIAGGYGITNAYLGSAEIYDPVSGTFAATGSMIQPRVLARAVLLPSGSVFISSGGNPSSLAGPEIYDATSGSFRAAGQMASLRAQPSVALLPDGRVLVAGGYASGGSFATAELYDSATNTFAPAASMLTARSDAVTATLAGGRVLVAGGNAAGPVSTAEVFDPAGRDLGPCPSAPTPTAGAVGVSVNDGAVYTNSPKVTLSVNWPACTTALSVSNDGGFKKAQAFAAKATISWTLVPSGPERLPKTVYLRFGSSTQTYSDDIILDQTPPRLKSATAIPFGNRMKVTTKASDKTSGVKKIQVTTSKKKPGKALKYRKALTVKALGKAIWVRVQDGAGNWSKWVKAK
jgi:hypothetical protein